MYLNENISLTFAVYYRKYTTRIPEMLGRFLNLNKMKTETISKSHEPIFYSQ